MNPENKNNEQITLEETSFCSASTTSPYTTRSGDTALGRLTFIVSGESYKAEESPWDFLCSDLKPALYIAAPSQEEELQKEFQAWDAASDEIHGE